MTIKEIIKPSKQLHINGMLRIESEDDRFIGPGRIELLEKIIETGSISQAAKLMGMSYKKAWLMVQSLNRQASTPLIVTQTGGEQGGGAQLSNEARELIKAYQDLRGRFEAFLAQETQSLLRQE
jgi:molybdate transport system regulatory protein